MIEALKSAATETAETSKEVSSKSLENKSPFADSARPTEGNMELPKLKDSDRLLENRQYSDSDRPFNARGIEQPKLKSVSENNDNNANKSADNSNTSDADDKRIPCRNEELAGKKHPVTGVPFEKRTIMVDGEEREVVVPVFDSVFDAQLPEDKLKATDREQFKECNKQLKEAVENDPELRAKFTEEQLEQIANGDTPDGYTWHHDAETGKMQLVDTETHARTGHTGGQNFWGGGSNNR
jgi:hypothetical protein